MHPIQAFLSSAVGLFLLVGLTSFQGFLAPAPAAGFAAVQVDGKTAVALVRAHEEYNRIPTWSAPELVVFAGLDLIQRRLTFWFVAPDDYRASSVYGRPQDRETVEL